MKALAEISIALLLLFTVACKNYNETENNLETTTTVDKETDVRRDSTAMNKDEALDVHTNNNPE